MIQPVIKPVVQPVIQPVGQPAASCKRGNSMCVAAVASVCRWCAVMQVERDERRRLQSGRESRDGDDER